MPIHRRRQIAALPPRRFGLKQTPMLALAASLALMSGCLERVIHVTTEPPGALVHLNDREVGRTPLEIPFQEFGTYDVRVELAGYEPIHTGAEASAPPWEWPGLDLAAMILPFPFKTEVRWHYDLQASDFDEAALLERATRRRDAFQAELAEEAEEAASEPPTEGDQN
ncbi:MAG: PEGA domain-containing protein [Phycisphaerales bacterium JB038]